MASEDDSSPSPATIQLDAMSLDQLDQVKQREESRLHALSTRYQALRGAAGRLTACQHAVDGWTPAAPVLVPLTESVYVPGITIDSPFLVELGTGYYCEKNAEDTQAFLRRKGDLVDANADNVTQAIQTTRQNLESVAMAMRGKIMEMQARQQGARTMRAEAES